MSKHPLNPHDDQSAPSSADDALVERLLTDAPDAAHADARDENRDEANALAATLAALALSVPPSAAVSADPVRARLLARASADIRQRADVPAESRTETPSATADVPLVAIPMRESAARPGEALPLRVERGRSTASPARPRTAWWIASLTTLAAAASLLLVLRLQTDRTALRNTVASLEDAQRAGQLQLDSLAVALSERDAQLASVTGPDVAVVELASTGALPPAGRMFWDRATARWTFVANNMPDLEVGRTYALWLLTVDERILAGYFAPDARGVAVVRATYELPRTALSAVAVTEEPDIGVEQPTGAIVLVGSAGSAP